VIELVTEPEGRGRAFAAVKEAQVKRFYFELAMNDEIRLDADGIELADEKAARREAVMAIASIAADEIPLDGPLQVAISVLNEQKVQVFWTRVTFDFDEVGPGG
jgi:hypothetical protein